MKTLILTLTGGSITANNVDEFLPKKIIKEDLIPFLGLVLSGLA